MQAAHAYLLEALGDVRLMDVLRGGESEAFVARFCVAPCKRGVVERPRESVRAVFGEGDGVGMVKS